MGGINPRAEAARDVRQIVDQGRADAATAADEVFGHSPLGVHPLERGTGRRVAGGAENSTDGPYRNGRKLGRAGILQRGGEGQPGRALATTS